MIERNKDNVPFREFDKARNQLEGAGQALGRMADEINELYADEARLRNWLEFMKKYVEIKNDLLRDLNASHTNEYKGETLEFLHELLSLLDYESSCPCLKCLDKDICTDQFNHEKMMQCYIIHDITEKW